MTQLAGQAPEFSIIVPVFNAEATLGPLTARIVEVMESRGAAFEIVLVDDCGGDGSWSKARELAADDSRIVAVQLMRNYGQSAATMCGLAQARGEYLITLDDDLQNPPEEINVLIDSLAERPDVDVIFGSPVEKRHSLWRRFGSWMVNRISAGLILRTDAKLELTSFRILRRSVADSLLAVSTPRPAPGAMLCTITPRIINVPVRHEERGGGVGGYTIGKLLGLTIDKTLSFSTLPLRLLASMGLIGIVFSAVLGCVYLSRYYWGGIAVPGWTTQVLLMIGIAGFNFFALGVIGEYLLRILQTVQGTPQYLVRQQVGGGPAARHDAAPGE